LLAVNCRANFAKPKMELWLRLIQTNWLTVREKALKRQITGLRRYVLAVTWISIRAINSAKSSAGSFGKWRTDAQLANYLNAI
jgi:hypothetical protein